MPTKLVGNWAATADGDTYFSFGVPEDLTGFVGARVLLIGTVKGAITYDLNLSVAKKGQTAEFLHRLAARPGQLGGARTA